MYNGSGEYAARKKCLGHILKAEEFSTTLYCHIELSVYIDIRIVIIHLSLGGGTKFHGQILGILSCLEIPGSNLSPQTSYPH